MPALRVLVHPRSARIQPVALLPTLLSRLLSSSASTCKRSAGLHPGRRSRQATNLPPSKAPISQACECKQLEHAQCSHMHGDEASVSNYQGAQHSRDPEERGSLISQISPRGKGKKKPESPESWSWKVSIIESCEQVSPANAAALRKSRALKSTSLEHLAAVLKVLEESLGSSERASQALAASPGILFHQSKLLEQKLKVLAHFGLTEEVFRKLCTKQFILSRKLESLYKLLIVFEEIGLSRKARNMLLGVKYVASQGTGLTLLHASDFFECIGMDGKDVSRLLERWPAMFVRSVHALKGYYAFFQKFGLNLDEFKKILFRGFPAMAIGALDARVKFLKDQGFSDSDIKLLIVRRPRILGLRHGYLQEKLDFLRREHEYDTTDIVRCPGCLTLSLQGRLIPRLTAVKERGLFKVLPLSSILNCKNTSFQKLLESREKGWRPAVAHG